MASKIREITVKLRYNVFLGTVKNSTLYQRYVVTTFGYCSGLSTSETAPQIASSTAHLGTVAVTDAQQVGLTLQSV